MSTYHAILTTDMDPDKDLGTFDNLDDAKQACQDDEPDCDLVWDDFTPPRSIAKPDPFKREGWFIITRSAVL